MGPIFLVWFRQDLRIEDNPALSIATNTGTILPFFILDEKNAGQWKAGTVSRWWLHESLQQLNLSLDNKLWIFKGDPNNIIKKLVTDHNIKAIYWNRCYEPWQIKRDKLIKSTLEHLGVSVYTFNANLLWEPWENLKQDNTPYKIFTPFYKNGVKNLTLEPSIPTNISKLQLTNCAQDHTKIASLKLLPPEIRYREIAKYWSPGETSAKERLYSFIGTGIENYKNGRNFPAQNSVSRLSPYIHFGEISPRQILREIAGSTQGLKLEEQLEHFRRELAWRDFSYSLLYHFPNITDQNMNKKFDQYPWRDNRRLLEKWQKGETGFPLIDAGMRQLRRTGFMHNRVRMITGSFLVKNLNIRWQYGAKWFWDYLVDADLANNSCSWQWVAGCGADAAPYFRIFNPVSQSEKFDPTGSYIRTYVTELRKCPDKLIHDPGSASRAELKTHGIEIGLHYPAPIVDLRNSRNAALTAYKALKEQAQRS